MELELIVDWPNLLVDLQFLHKKGLQSPTIRCKEYQSEYVGFSESRKAFLARSFDWIYSRAEIMLSFQV